MRVRSLIKKTRLPYYQELLHQGFTAEDVSLLEAEFDEEGYHAAYPDVAADFELGLDHFVRFGAAEGRRPVSWFNPTTYLLLHPDVAMTGMNPFLHYLVAGRHEGRTLEFTHQPVDVVQVAETEQRLVAATAAVVAEPPVPPSFMVTFRGRDLGSAAGELDLRTSDKPVLSVIVPVHNRVDLTLELLASLGNSEDVPPFEIVVVDDASELEEAEVLRKVGAIRLFRSEKNVGFGAACNLGASKARGQWLFFVNSDAQVAPDCLARLVEAAEEHDECGVFGPQLIYPNGYVQESGGLLHPSGGSQMLGFGADSAAGEHRRTRTVDFVSGAALLIAKSHFEDVDGFDQVYGRGYYEDVDLCLRVERDTGLRSMVVGDAVTVHHLSSSMFDRDQQAKLQYALRNSLIFNERWHDRAQDHGLKTVAFYLPQFHRIEENDRWWGPGFTEWTNVVRATPAYRTHNQPKVPTLLGHYDLTDVRTLASQAELAARFGVDAFCFYYYSFEGRNPLGRPLSLLLENPDIDLAYCLSWANEPWSRNWDGGDRATLLAQPNTDEEVLLAAEGMVPHLEDPRYLRVGDAPIVLVYRPQLAPNPGRLSDLMRNAFAAAGIPEVHLVATESFELARHPFDVREWGFDASVEFPPHEVGIPFAQVPSECDGHAAGSLFDYEAMAAVCLNRPPTAWGRYRTVCPRWDNTPRQPERPTIFHGATPQAFATWTREAMRRTREEHGPDQRLLFINAWNEWGEGAMLEPESEHGTAFLEALAYARAEVTAP